MAKISVEKWKNKKVITARTSKGKLLSYTKEQISVEKARIRFKENQTLIKDLKRVFVFDSAKVYDRTVSRKPLKEKSFNGKRAVLFTATVDGQLVIGQSRTRLKLDTAFKEAETRFWRIVAGIKNVPNSNPKKAKEKYKNVIMPKKTIRIYQKAYKK